MGYLTRSGRQQRSINRIKNDQTLKRFPTVRYGAFVPQLQGTAKAVPGQLPNRPIDRCVKRRQPWYHADQRLSNTSVHPQPVRLAPQPTGQGPARRTSSSTSSCSASVQTSASVVSQRFQQPPKRFRHDWPRLAGARRTWTVATGLSLLAAYYKPVGQRLGESSFLLGQASICYAVWIPRRRGLDAPMDGNAWTDLKQRANK